VRVSNAPDFPATVAASSTDAGIPTVTPASLTFTPSNWSASQTLYVAAADDAQANLDDRFARTLGQSLFRAFAQLPGDIENGTVSPIESSVSVEGVLYYRHILRTWRAGPPSRCVRRGTFFGCPSLRPDPLKREMNVATCRHRQLRSSSR